MSARFKMSSAEIAFERLQRLDLQESNLLAGFERLELKPEIRDQLLRLFDRISAERRRLLEVVVTHQSGTIGSS